MATHDYNIANNTAAAVRIDINNVLQAIRSTNLSGTPPTQTFAGLLWFDTTTTSLKMRNSADTAWLDISTTDGVVKAPTSSGLDFQNSSSVSRMTMNNGGDFQADGDITAGGNLTAYSDERLKENIETLDGSKVFDMRGVSYTKDGKASSGVIAQEMSAVAPELVDDSREYLSVAYGNVSGYLIEAIKVLKEKIDEQDEKIKSLEERLDA
jgi:hypothetical protein